MKLIQGKNANVNYLAKIVNIENFRKHSDPEVNKLKCCTVDGFNIICGIDSEPGLYVYFPTACCLNPDFLRYANLYRHKELNNDPEQSGMFEDNGRVKAIKLRGELSEGFILPAVMLQNYILSVTNVECEVEAGIEFDVVEHNGKTFWINKKYIPKNIIRQREYTKNSYSRQPKGIDRLIENQFRFHYDTVLIKKVPYAIQPDDIIQISSKIHGCVEANTIINTSEGKMTIKEIVDNKLPVEIEAFDINTNQKIFVPIDNYYTIPNDGEWYEIELEDGHTIKITGNNPIWLPELNCYRSVDQLKVGDSVLVS